MTDYTALRAASETLRAFLAAHITASPEADLAGTPVDLRSPDQLEKDSVTKAVSLWLHRVTIQPDVFNASPPRLDESTLARQPLALELSYHVTALHSDPGTALALTGRVLQVIHDHGRIRGADLKDTLAGTDAELRVSLEPSPEVRGVDARHLFKSQWRLAMPVQLQFVVIESHLPPRAAPPVLERRAQVSAL